MDSEHTDDTRIFSSALERLDALCDEFEAALSKSLTGGGDDPRLETYLARCEVSQREKLFRELLEIEVELYRRSGKIITEEDYSTRFPDYVDTIQEVLPKIEQSSRLGEYELLELLGRGGMGVVYRARHLMLNQIVAVKVLPERYAEMPNAASRFRREMLSIGTLDHPNIVKAQNAGQVDEALYLVMEFIDGVGLDKLTRGGRYLSPPLACEMIRQAASGLQHAYQHGLVHRDIKPANLMLSRSGVLKILDMGLARFRDDAAGDNITMTDTARSMTLGTIDYMAPEQWENPTEVDIRADIYSLGCTLFRLLTGRSPYKDVPPRGKFQAHATMQFPSTAPITGDEAEEIDALLARMVAKKPDDRFQTPAELEQAIAPLSDGSEIPKILAEYDETKARGKEIGARVDARAGAVSPGAEVGDSNADGPTPVPVLRTPTSSDLETLRSDRAGASMGSGSEIELITHSGHRARRIAIPAIIAVLMLAVIAPLVLLWTSSGEDSLHDNPLIVSERHWLSKVSNPLPGPSGNWWFDEMPWLSPMVRRHLSRAIVDERTPIEPSRLRQIYKAVENGDSTVLFATLRELILHGDLIQEISDPDERHVARMLSALDPSQLDESTFKKELTEVLGQPILAQPKTADQYYTRALLLHRLGNREDAEAAYRQALRLYEQDRYASGLASLCSSDLGQLKLDEGSLVDARARFEQAAATSPDAIFLTVYCRAQQADTYRKSGDFAAARSAIEDAEAIVNSEAAAARFADHPLLAFLLERRAWLYVETWQLDEAKKVFERATAIRLENRDHGDRRSWRWILFDRQGEAMVDFFLGDQQSAIEGISQLIGEIDTALSGNFTARTLDANQRRELVARLPNLYERLGDCYLYGSEVDASQAADRFMLAIESAGDARLVTSPAKWPHLNRLRFKYAIALQAAGRTDEARTYLNQIALPLETSEKEKLFEGDVPESISKWYDVDRAIAIAADKLADSNPDIADAGFEELRTLAVDTDPVDRRNIHAVLLAMELFFNEIPNRPVDVLTRTAVGEVARRMLNIADLLQGNVSQSDWIRRMMGRYLEAARKAVTHVSDDTVDSTLSRIQSRLDAILSPDDSSTP